MTVAILVVIHLSVIITVLVTKLLFLCLSSVASSSSLLLLLLVQVLLSASYLCYSCHAELFLQRLELESQGSN